MGLSLVCLRIPFVGMTFTLANCFTIDIVTSHHLPDEQWSTHPHHPKMQINCLRIVALLATN
jgi:hypothetical protein